MFEVGRENDKEKKKKRSRLHTNHCAPGCWITSTCTPTRSLGHHILNNILEQFTNISFTCAHQFKIVRPLGLHYIARPLGLHFYHYVSLARPLGLHYNYYVSPSVHLSVRLWSVSKMLITVCAHYCQLMFFRSSCDIMKKNS